MNKYAGSLKTQCRACLEMSSYLYPLEELPANCDVTISTMISYCTLTEMDLSDDLPSGLCVQCFRTVRIAYNFIRQYKDSQKKLLEEKTDMESNQIEGETESDEKNSNVENDTASEDEEKNRDQESQGSQSRLEYDFAEEDQETSDVREECYIESEDYVEQDDIDLGNNTVEIETECDTNDSDLLVEQFDSELYEVEDGNIENNYQVRVVRHVNPPNDSQSTIFRMKMNTRYLCPVCPNVFFRHFERGLMRHMTLHKDETFSCNICSESQTEHNSDTFLKHYAEVHLNQCYLCHKSFSKRCSLLYHIKTHTNILYHCKQVGCRKVCPSQAALTKHEATHANSVKHVCSECGMNFKTYDTFRYHMNRHNGKKFLCSICGRTFILSVNLKNHMLAHKGGRPFKCSFCHKTYTSYTPLNKHMRKNHADKKIENSRYYQYDDVNT